MTSVVTVRSTQPPNWSRVHEWASRRQEGLRCQNIPPWKRRCVPTSLGNDADNACRVQRTNRLLGRHRHTPLSGSHFHGAAVESTDPRSQCVIVEARPQKSGAGRGLSLSRVGRDWFCCLRRPRSAARQLAILVTQSPSRPYVCSVRPRRYGHRCRRIDTWSRSDPTPSGQAGAARQREASRQSSPDP